MATAISSDGISSIERRDLIVIGIWLTDLPRPFAPRVAFLIFD
jgi:hypothetical protein